MALSSGLALEMVRVDIRPLFTAVYFVPFEVSSFTGLLLLLAGKWRSRVIASPSFSLYQCRAVVVRGWEESTSHFIRAARSFLAFTHVFGCVTCPDANPDQKSSTNVLQLVLLVLKSLYERHFDVKSLPRNIKAQITPPFSNMSLTQSVLVNTADY